MGSLCIMFKEYKAIFTFCLCLCSLLDVFNFWKRVNASDEIIWRTPCSTSADPLGVADPRLKTSVLWGLCVCMSLCVCVCVCVCVSVSVSLSACGVDRSKWKTSVVKRDLALFHNDRFANGELNINFF